MTSNNEINLSVLRPYLPMWEQDNIYDHFIYKGGSGSGKSVAVADRLVDRAESETAKDFRHKILVVRQTAATLRDSCIVEIKNALFRQNIQFSENKTEKRIVLSNGAEFLFVGLDDVDKLKSISGITLVWIEEADQIKQDDYLELKRRVRGQYPFPKTFYVTFNPTDVDLWLRSMFFDEKKSNVYTATTTWRDNPFLDKSDIQNLLDLQRIDPKQYQVYSQGDWGSAMKGLIFPPNSYEIIEDFPKYAENEVSYGQDWGSNDPNALIKIVVQGLDLYTQELIYTPELIPEEIADQYPKLGITKNDPVIADSSRKDSIDVVQRKGFNIRGCVKYNGSVIDGINRIKAYKWHIVGSPNIQKEVKKYKWKERSDGESTDIPQDKFNHAIDAIRYGLEEFANPLLSGNYQSSLTPEPNFVPDYLDNSQFNSYY